MKNSSSILLKPIVIPRTFTIPFKIILFAFLTALGAWVSIRLPFTPVPVTLQTLFVLLSGASLGPIYGSLSQFTYVLLGVSGLPLFAGVSSGISVLLGPTGGYLLGFTIAPLLTGLICKKKTSFALFLSLVAGEIPIFFLGVSFLMLRLGVSIVTGLNLGFFPFIPGEILKVGLAYSLLKAGVFIVGRVR